MRSFLNIFFVVGVVSILSLASALATDKKKKHRHHEAHMHGAGKMSMAFDGLKGRIEFKVAAESILGFEYVPKTQTDQVILLNATNTFHDQFAKLVQFDVASGCVMTADKIGQKAEGKDSKHSDFEATYDVLCKQSILKTTVKFNFIQYSNLKDIDVTILVDKLQKNVEVSGKELSVELK